MGLPDSTPPETPALEAWYDTHPSSGPGDSPKTSLWFPQEPPWVNLDTVNVGGFHDVVERLPDPERVTCHVHLGSKIDIGGYLSEMEAYFAAVVEALRVARWQADNLAPRTAAEGGEVHQ